MKPFHHSLTTSMRLAELADARAWSTIPLRGGTLREALRAVERPASAIGTVMSPLRVNPAKTIGDIVEQRQRLSQALSRAAVRNTGANIARHQSLLKRGAVIRAVDDYVIPHANPLLGSRFREMSAAQRLARLVEFANRAGGEPKRMIQLKGPATAKKPEQEGWIARNKWKLAGGAAMLAGLGTYAAIKDRGMKMPYNPHQSVGQEIIGIKPQAAKDWEAAQRKTAQVAKRAGAKAEQAVATAIQPTPPTAVPTARVPRTIKPETVQRATNKLWENLASKKITPGTALKAYTRFWGSDATKGIDIGSKLAGKNGDGLRGRALKLRIGKLKGEMGPIAPKAPVLAAAIRRKLVELNEADPDQYNKYAPSLFGGTLYRKGRKALVAVKRSGNIAQDAADTVAGKPRQPGQKKEWEKSWFKNMVAGAAIGAGIWGAPRLYSTAVTRRSGNTIRPGTTWPDMVGSLRRGEAKALLPQKALGAKLRLALLAARQKCALTLLAGVDRLRMVHLDDWRLADARGNSARVFSPKAKTRDRREKTEWEKAATQRAVRNVAIGTAVGLGGLTAYLGLKNAKLRRVATPAATVAAPMGDAVEAAFKATAKVPSAPLISREPIKLPQRKVSGDDVVIPFRRQG
jgi:hypothetical protein